MNKVFTLGNLTKDVQSGTTGNDKTWCKFSMAVKRPYADKVDYLNVITWGNTATNCIKYLRKGSKVLVEGYIITGSYEKNGVKHYTTDIQAEKVEFLSSNNGGGQAKQQSTSIDDLQEIADNDSSMPF